MTMKYRRVRYPFLIFSLIIHIVLLICLWWFYTVNEPPFQYKGTVISDLYYLPRPNIVKPPDPLVEPSTTNTELTVEEKIEKTPIIPKPSVDLKTGWQTNVNIDNSHTREDMRRTETQSGRQKPERDATEFYAVVPNVKVSDRPTLHSKPQDVNQEVLAFPHATGTYNDDVSGDTKKVQFDTKNSLSSNSPSVNAPNIPYGSKRGDALRATSISNTWGKGGSSASTNLSGIYPKMMKAIAEQLRTAATSDKLDIVLILDETASMVDNISGIRAYFDTIFDTLARDNRDANYGLVTFTDKTKHYRLTDDLSKFRNWLYKIDVDHGGDLSESGLDAIMSAVNKMKFRQDAQRFFILASDAAFHDADYDGRSPYSLDEVIETLQKQQIQVEVIGLDYLPIKQIALATGGTWRAIPGKGYLEYVPKITLTMKMLSKLGTLSVDGSDGSDKIIVYVNNPPRPKEIKLIWKVLNPLGERCYGPFTNTTEIPDDDSTSIELTPELKKTEFQTIPGTYTIIYKLENDRGHKSILRRTLTFQH